MRAMRLRLGWGVVAALACGLPTLGHAGHAGCIRRLEAGEKQVVVAYGTSLTEWGVWVDDLRAALERKFPGLATVINSGGAGQWSQWGVKNLDQKVLQHHPDLVFIEFSINDCVDRFGVTVDAARANLEEMIRRIREQAPEAEIILMTMTPGNRHPEGHRSHRSGQDAHYAMVREVAKCRSLGLIDHYPRWLALQRDDPQRFKRLVPDSVHPTAEGCRAVVTPAVLEALGLDGGR